MTPNRCRFETRWRVDATPELVTEILSDAASFPCWWPQVYLPVREESPTVCALRRRGWLPHTLRWKSRVTSTNHPYGFALQALRDLEGSDVWTFIRDGEWTIIDYLWLVSAEKPKPLFAANHRWAMARGEESLTREVERRR